MPTEVLHSLMTGAELHESLGVAGATVNSKYSSDGLGSGSWGTNARVHSVAHNYRTVEQNPSGTSPNIGQFIVPFDCTVSSIYVISSVGATLDSNFNSIANTDIELHVNNVAVPAYSVSLSSLDPLPSAPYLAGVYGTTYDTTGLAQLSAGDYVRFNIKSHLGAWSIYEATAQFQLTEAVQ